MCRRQRRNADDVYVVLDRLARRLDRRCEQGADIDIETEIGEGGGNDFLPAVVTVLADLGDQDAWAAAFIVFELGDKLPHPFDRVRHAANRHAGLPSIDTGNRLDLGLMAAESLFQRQRNLAHGRLGARRIDRQRQQITVAAAGAAGQRLERGLERLRVALTAKPLELIDLQLPYRRIVHFEHIDRLLFLRAEFVDADHRLRAGIDAGLRARRRFLDAQLRQAGFDGPRHAAELLDFTDMREASRRKLAG